ncbi:hypothetical protein JBKA6_1067 [Ichthyobacterium seriolicida]|uniref:Uncharacterized protein n=1 Tax=Ichthyobacterium seriolicida TaxID=242600 RepID=A0A1J1EC45_9FLAO|nr:hypothetical protein JBKA6_1067 [Ichthyobacterium seriolicida]
MLFQTDASVMKSTFLALREATKKWSKPILKLGNNFESIL